MKKEQNNFPVIQSTVIQFLFQSTSLEFLDKILSAKVTVWVVYFSLSLDRRRLENKNKEANFTHINSESVLNIKLQQW